MSAAKAAKKAAKKVAKKAAKKTAGHHRNDDLRRAYEHLGRVEILECSLTRSTHDDVHTLAELAHIQVQAGEAGDAADLLRAAEHLSFAALGVAELPRQGTLSHELQSAIFEEFAHLVDRAEHHWENGRPHPAPVAELYTAALNLARRAYAEASFRQALELARAAEALAHVHGEGLRKLPAGSERHRIAS